VPGEAASAGGRGRAKRRHYFMRTGFGGELVMAGKRFLSTGLFYRGCPEDYALWLHGD